MHETSIGVLSSGSCGNATLLTSGEDSVLVDAGISCRELEHRMSFFGIEPTQVEAVVLTHEHTDHVRGAKRFCLDHSIPVHATRGTLALTPLEGVTKHMFSHNNPFYLGNFRFEPFKVRHFAAEPVSFAVRTGSLKIGLASDLGSVTPGVVEALRGASLLLIEANYDEKMLMTGSYPEFLKRTIKGSNGHLSNLDAGVLSSKTASELTRRIVLVHLSKENNTPEKAKETVEGVLKKARISSPVEVAEHGMTSGPYRLD